MTIDIIDAIEQITNIISNIGILLVYILLARIAWKTYKWTSEWSKKIRHGSPVEGRCYYNFENQDGTTIEYNRHYNGLINNCIITPRSEV